MFLSSEKLTAILTKKETGGLVASKREIQAKLRIAFRNFKSKKREGRNWLMSLLGFFSGFLLGVGVTARGLWKLFGIFSPTLMDSSGPRAYPLWFDSFFLYITHAVFGIEHFRTVQWHRFNNWLIETDNVWKIDGVVAISCLTGIAAGTLFGYLLGLGKVKIVHEEGRKLYDSVDDAFLGTKDEIAVSGEGIRIHPQVPISRDRETRHIMVMGSIGAGKTQVIRNIVKSILARFSKSKADRLIVYDNKSDFTAGVPIPEKMITVPGPNGEMIQKSAPPEDQDYILLAPWDERTYAWDVAKDVLNDVDAVEICKRIIPSSDDPFWSNAAREVLVAVFIKLQQERGTNWSWKDIYEEIGDADKIANAVLTYNSAMGSLFRDPTSKTAQSVLTTLATFALTIRLLTQAWDNVNPLTGQTYEEGRHIPKISLREWALMPEVRQRVVILQGNKRYATLEKSFIQSIISAFGAIMNSPEMTDSPNRRIWFILDEFPQLGKLEDFAPYLEVGRSKGLCVILGLQDMAQLREIYKRETADVWAAICGTFIICRSQGVETLDWIKKFAGDRTIKRWTRSTGKGGGSRSEQVSKEGLVAEKDVLGLGPKKTGVEAMLSLNNEFGIYKLIWPYVSFKNERPAQIQAGWTRYVATTSVETETQKLQDAIRRLEEGFNAPMFDSPGQQQEEDVLFEEEGQEALEEDYKTGFPEGWLNPHAGETFPAVDKRVSREEPLVLKPKKGSDDDEDDEDGDRKETGEEREEDYEE